MKRPETTEYHPYYEGYVSKVSETDILAALETQIGELEELVAAIPEEKGSYAYEQGKWTIKQLLGHLIDGERVFAYRALRFARADETPLPGFDQDPYVENGNFDNATVADLGAELILLRKANLLFFRNIPQEAWSRRGVASSAEVTVRALAYIMVGHIRHHSAIMRERYLAG